MRKQYLCVIKYDENGKQFIQTLREQMADVGKHLKLRGRGHRHGVKHYRQDLPLSLATYVALYVV